MNTFFKVDLPSPIGENVGQCAESLWMVVVVRSP